MNGATASWPTSPSKGPAGSNRTDITGDLNIFAKQIANCSPERSKTALLTHAARCKKNNSSHVGVRVECATASGTTADTSKRLGTHWFRCHRPLLISSNMNPTVRFDPCRFRVASVRRVGEECAHQRRGSQIIIASIVRCPPIVLKNSAGEAVEPI